MDYNYQLKQENINFEEGVKLFKNTLNNRVKVGSINNIDPGCVKWISNNLFSMAIQTRGIKIEINDYKQFVLKARYREKYPDYYSDNFIEKTLEHFLCFSLLELKPGEKFIDIASEHSPVVEIFSNLTGSIGYSQDIMYDNGIHGYKIGGNAAEIPVPDSYFNAAIATCSIEHFENDSDIQFMNEMERILIPGGKIIIVPLYLYHEHACQTDPKYSIPGDVHFDNDAVIYCANGWGNRHGRFYSPKSLVERLINPNKKIKFQVLILENMEEINPSIYCKFILVGTKL